jgi:hypothetical protein
MSFSYNAIVNSGSGAVTLPSAEMWGSNMNILKDPPKSIMTRRIDKVGDTMGLVVSQDDSSDRSCEAILQYARGVNPFVSVSYSNSDGTPSKLPYRIMDEGAFRPPIMTQAQLYPLSRQPRNWVSVCTNPAVEDFTKKIMCPQSCEKTRETRNTILKTNCRPNAIYQVMMPAQESKFEVKNVIQNPVRTSATAGMRSMDITERTVKQPLKEIDISRQNICAQSNVSENIYVNNNGDFNSNKFIQNNPTIYAKTNVSDNKYVNNNGDFRSDKFIQDNINTSAITNLSDQNIYINNNGEFNSDKYIQDNMLIHANTNGSLNIQVTPIDELFDMSDVRVKDTLHSNYRTPIQGHQKTDYISTDVDLERNLPEYYATTNTNNSNVHKRMEYDKTPELSRRMPSTNVNSNVASNRVNINDDINAKSYNRLPSKISAGQYYGKAAVPMKYKDNDIRNVTTKKSQLNHMVSDDFNSRFNQQIVA